MAGDGDDDDAASPLSEASRKYLEEFLAQVRRAKFPDSPALIEKLEGLLQSKAENPQRGHGQARPGGSQDSAVGD